MIAQFFKSSFIVKRPGRFPQSVRFFIVGIGLLLIASCSSGKKVVGIKNSKPDKVAEVYGKADTIISEERADAIFIDAVKAKILDNKEEAFRKYSLYASLHPDNAAVHYELSRIWMERNNFPKALLESKTALQHAGENKWVQRQYADLLAYDGRYIEAAVIYGKMADKERAPEELLVRESLLLQKAKKYTEALAVIDKLAQHLGDDDETLLLQKEQLYLSMNDVEAAAGEVRKLIKFYPRESRYALLLAEVYENNNLDKKAEQVYRDIEQQYPDDPGVQFALLQYHLKSKNLNQVEYYLEKAVMNDKVGIEDRIGLLLPFIQYHGADSSSRKMAMNLTRKLAGQEPPQLQVITLYADLMVSDGELDEALAQYKRVVHLDSSIFTAWQQIMYIYTTKSENDSLIAYGERAIELFPKEPIVYYLSGLGYMQSKRNDKAVDYLNKAVRYQTNTNDNLLTDILVSLGDVYNMENKFTSSDSCYDAALNLQPNNAMALNNFSYYLSVRGEKLDEAEKMSAKSLKLRPNEATFMDTYGWILYKQGKYKEAKVYIQKAIDLSMNNADATLWEHLGDVEYKLGNKKDALIHWKTAVSKGEVSSILQQKINEQKLHD